MYNLSEEIQNRIKNIEPIFLEKILKSFPNNGINYDCNIKETIKALRYDLFSGKNLKPHTSEYWTLRGWSEADADSRRLKRNKDWYINKFGLIDGNKKWCNYTKSDMPKSQRQIKRNERKLNQISKIKGKFKNTLNNYIQIYGKDLGEIKYREFCKKSSRPNPKKGNRMSLNDYIIKYGELNGYSKYLKKNKINGPASKGSLKLFLPLIKMLNNVDDSDIMIGYNGKKEKRLFYNNGKNWYWYDFTIESKMKIIEYNGLRYHKDKERDLHKIKIAENNGYEVLTIWSSNDLNNNIELALKFIYGTK